MAYFGMFILLNNGRFRDSMGERLKQGRHLRQDDIMMLTYLKFIEFSIDGLIMLGETA
jgi:hypothetical protein